MELALEEAQIIKGLSHQSIVKCFKCREREKFIFIELEYLRGGTLAERIQRHRFSDEEAAIVLKGILEGLEYLHGKNIVHRDLKPANIMFANDKVDSIKLLDFGLSARNSYSDFMMDGMVGTQAYMAPELINKRDYTEEVDIWSTGLIMYNLLTGKHPIQEYNTHSGYFQEVITKGLDRLQFPKQFSDLSIDLFKRLTHSSPIERYSANRALRHPWITRVSGDSIPLTYTEQMNRIYDQDLLKQMIQTVCFLAVIKKQTSSLPISYKMRLENPFWDIKRGRSSLDMSSTMGDVAQKGGIRVNRERKVSYGNRLVVPMIQTPNRPKLPVIQSPNRRAMPTLNSPTRPKTGVKKGKKRISSRSPRGQ